MQKLRIKAKVEAPSEESNAPSGRVRIKIRTAAERTMHLVVVSRRATGMREIFKAAKLKFTSKKNKLKKPSRLYARR